MAVRRSLILTMMLALLPVVLRAASAEVVALTTRAEAGDAEAQRLLAIAYDTGAGVWHSANKAEKWYRAAAGQGDAFSQNAVGSLLQERRKYAEALTWYEKAAAGGFARAVHNIGYLHDLGLGVPQDRMKGRDYYVKAANLGWAESMWNLANMYALGQIGPVDNHQACIWTVRALTYAELDARQLRTYASAGEAQLRGSMKPEDYQQCLKEADDWKPQGVPAGAKPAAEQ